MQKPLNLLSLNRDISKVEHTESAEHQLTEARNKSRFYFPGRGRGVANSVLDPLRITLLLPLSGVVALPLYIGLTLFQNGGKRKFIPQIKLSLAAS